MEQIGYFKRMHGLKGALVLKLIDKVFFLGAAGDALFIEQQGTSVPYFIESIGGAHPEWIVKLNQVQLAEAEKLVAAKVSAMPDRFTFEASFSSEYAYLVGFQFIDATSQKKGIVKDIEDMTHQTILYIEMDKKEILVPIHQDWIVSINKDLKEMVYNCPLGLLDVYLQ